MNKEQSVREAGYSTSTARHHANRIVDRVSTTMAAALEECGLTAERLAELYAEGAESEDLNIRIRFLNRISDIRGDNAPTRRQHEIQSTMPIEERRREQTAMWERLSRRG